MMYPVFRNGVDYTVQYKRCRPDRTTSLDAYRKLLRKVGLRCRPSTCLWVRPCWVSVPLRACHICGRRIIQQSNCFWGTCHGSSHGSSALHWRLRPRRLRTRRFRTWRLGAMAVGVMAAGVMVVGVMVVGVMVVGVIAVSAMEVGVIAAAGVTMAGIAVAGAMADMGTVEGTTAPGEAATVTAADHAPAMATEIDAATITPTDRVRSGLQTAPTGAVSLCEA